MSDEQAAYLITHIRRIADALEALATIAYAKLTEEDANYDLPLEFGCLKDLGFAPVWEEAELDAELKKRIDPFGTRDEDGE